MQSSYRQILKSSSIMGGAAAVTMLFSLVRTKFAAEFIGVMGVALLANFTVLQNLITTVTGLGLQSSAVRDVASHAAKDNEEDLARVVLGLRRMCWLIGLLGLLMMVLMSPLLSFWTFGSYQYTLEIALLGVVVFFVHLNGGQMVLFQGLRKMATLAKINIITALWGTLLSVIFYMYWGIHGIIPALLMMSFSNWLISCFFAKSIVLKSIKMTWLESFVEVSGMVRMGMVMMSSALMNVVIAYVINLLIIHQIGLQSVGLYSAAFALSGTLVNFILSAMGADYYPRLVGVAHDKSLMNQMINEQIEVGVLLAAPGLLVLMVFAPMIVDGFYTQEFAGAVPLLRLFILGCLGRVISWPLGFLMLALGKGRLFFITELLSNIMHIVLVGLGLWWFGLVGVGGGFFVLYVFYFFLVYVVAKRSLDFKLSTQNQLIVGFVLLAFMVSKGFIFFGDFWMQYVVILFFMMFCFFYGLKRFNFLTYGIRVYE